MYPPRVSYFQTQKDTLLIIINKNSKHTQHEEKKKWRVFVSLFFGVASFSGAKPLR
jgi:hypothetical protein